MITLFAITRGQVNLLAACELHLIPNAAFSNGSEISYSPRLYAKQKRGIFPLKKILPII